ASGGSATGTVARPGPPAVGGGVRPGAPAVRRPIPRVPSSQTSILTPTSQARDPWYRRAASRLPAGRYIALIVAGILVLGGGAAYALTQLGGNSGTTKSGAPSHTSSKAPRSSGGKSGSSASSVSPSSVTVTVVNGTSTPNLARDTASKLSGIGFQIGNKVTGTGALAAAESVVEYKPGAAADARLVADRLHINQKQPADADALAQAGPASVIVVLGADQAPGG
ncbi:MAG: LytR cell envelope-related transcriptional attenuator, partial [Thermoleophilaceae bacterium]|nr:LytR cell envelope-related transcriptional attenuator [Thermoleophilaceae bacterium]